MEGTPRALPHTIKSVGLLGSHVFGRNLNFMVRAVNLGRELVRRRIRNAYDGGRIGLQGVIAFTVYKNGCPVRGFIPSHIATREVYGPTYGVEHRVSTNNYKYYEMNHVVETFLVLPGGVDTIKALFTLIFGFLKGWSTNPSVS